MGDSRCTRCQQRSKQSCLRAPLLLPDPLERFEPPRPACEACRKLKKACSLGARARALRHTPTRMENRQHPADSHPKGASRALAANSNLTSTAVPRPALFLPETHTALSLGSVSDPGTSSHVLSLQSNRAMTQRASPAQPIGSIRALRTRTSHVEAWPMWQSNRVIGEYAWRDYGWG